MFLRSSESSGAPGAGAEVSRGAFLLSLSSPPRHVFLLSRFLSFVNFVGIEEAQAADTNTMLGEPLCQARICRGAALHPEVPHYLSTSGCCLSVILESGLEKSSRQ